MCDNECISKGKCGHNEEYYNNFCFTSEQFEVIEKLIADEKAKTIDEFTKTLHEFMCNENCGSRRCVDDMDKCVWYGYICEVAKQMKGDKE